MEKLSGLLGTELVKSLSTQRRKFKSSDKPMKAPSLSIFSVLLVLCFFGTTFAQSPDANVDRFIIERVEYKSPRLHIIGYGFADNSSVSINGKDCTRYIVERNSRKIILDGNERRLNINSALNRVEVKSGPTTMVFLVAGLSSKRL